MKWEKLGNIFCPSPEYSWMASHAANPFGNLKDEHKLRVYFTFRDSQQRSHISFMDLDPNDKFKIKYISEKPVLSPGNLGLFDDSGVAMGYLLEYNGDEYLYYLGWNLKVTVPWQNSIGLAIRNKYTGEFKKISRAPILDRSDEDPYSISYPSILIEANEWHMWYGSNLSWGKEQHEMQHVIKYATSIDGIHWKRSNIIVINLEHPNEYAISKPFVFKKNGVYEMWYSYRANGDISSYRIGYADSLDGINWKRKDTEVGIDVSKTGWDSEMICYPYVFDHKGERYMLYNGNGYGKTGFGIAVLEN